MITVYAGLIVEAVDGGLNGCVVRSLTENESVAKDGRLRVGDFVVRVNDESLRRVTNAQARAILRRLSMLISPVTYVPSLSVARCSVFHKPGVSAMNTRGFIEQSGNCVQHQRTIVTDRMVFVPHSDI